MPNARTLEYSIYRACERFKIDPAKFYEMDREDQAKLVAYSSLRQDEEYNEALAKAKAHVRL